MREVFPTFICANNIGRLVNSLFSVKIFISDSSFASSSLSSDGKGGKSVNLSVPLVDFLQTIPNNHNHQVLNHQNYV